MTSERYKLRFALRKLALTLLNASALLFSGSAFAQGIVWEDTFTSGVTATQQQVDAWNAFLTDLGNASSAGSAVTISGSFDATGISCTDGTATQQIADLLSTSTNGLVSCDGHEWAVCDRTSHVELWLDPPSLCSGANCPDPGYIIRPGISNSNWGGVSTATCGAPTQTMRLEFGEAVATSARATFEVTKDFTDDNPSEVEVTISCNTGLVIEQSQGVSESRSVEFVVIEYDDGELDCEITEEVPDGYDVTYFDGTSSSSQSCEFVGVAHGAANSCRITNTPAPVDVVINKDWVFEGTTTGDGIDLRYDLTLFCDAEIVGGIDLTEQEVGQGIVGPGCGFFALSEDVQGGPSAEWCKTLSGEGPSNATHTAEVIPNYPDSNCFVVENVFDDAVEVDNGCRRGLTVSAGQGDSCTVTNTVFFEGIPTLNQYGLAVLALLMLGIGFVGFRRFA